MRKSILSGKIAAGDYLPPVRELCATHELSMDTVCRALGALESEGLIAAEPRQGYRVLARANDPERGCPLAVIMPAERRQWDELVVGLVEEIRVAAATRGRALLAIGVQGMDADSVIEQLRAAKAWGALVSVDDPLILRALSGAGVPMVLVETWAQGSGIDTIVQDGFRGAMAAAEWLVGRGHRRIAWFGHNPRNGHPQVVERFAGALAGMVRAGLDLPEELRFCSDAADPAGLAGAARRLLAGPERPEAVLALWQPQCQALATAAREMGLIPGKDFSMVGWVTTESVTSSYAPFFAGGEAPPAVTWSVRAMAETALARLEERRAKPLAPPITLEIPAELMVFGGSAAPRAGG